MKQLQEKDYQDFTQSMDKLITESIPAGDLLRTIDHLGYKQSDPNKREVLSRFAVRTSLAIKAREGHR
jgi:hypothetical protein